MDGLQRVLEAVPDAVLIVDTDGVVRQTNRTVEEVLGYEPEDLEGMVVEELLLEGDRERHVDLRERYMANPEPRPMGEDLDLYALRADGTEVPVEISLGPFARDGELFVMATVSDVTERKERERELERQNVR